MIKTITGAGGIIIKLRSFFHTSIIPSIFTDENKTHAARLLYLTWWTYILVASLLIWKRSLRL